MPTIRVTTVDGSIIDISDPARLEQELSRFESTAQALIEDLASADLKRVQPALAQYRTLSEWQAALARQLPEFERRRAEEEEIREGRRIAEELRKRRNGG